MKNQLLKLTIAMVFSQILCGELLSKQKNMKNTENEVNQELESQKSSENQVDVSIKNQIDEAPTAGTGRIDTPWDMRCPPGSHWEWQI